MYGPRPLASVLMQDLGHSFSQYGSPGWQITYIYVNVEQYIIIYNSFKCIFKCGNFFMFVKITRDLIMKSF